MSIVWDMKLLHYLGLSSVSRFAFHLSVAMLHPPIDPLSAFMSWTVPHEQGPDYFPVNARIKVAAGMSFVPLKS